MADRFLDFVGGNNSNDCTTFANRGLDITGGATAARSAPGDRWKCKKTGAPVSLAVNGTFTIQDDDVTLTSAVTQNVDLCNSAWTASANVTANTSTTRTEGAACITLAVASGFTTGLIAYKTIASTDFSGKQKISFRLKTNISVSASILRIDLCSDTAGATPVDSFTIDRATVSNTFHRFTYDKGSALGSAIQSVAIVALSDPGTPTISIDNIIACNDLDFTKLIGTSSTDLSMEWYPIRSINDTNIKLDMGLYGTVDSNTARGWASATTTTTAYVRDAALLSQNQTTNEGGSAGNVVTFSGGWDETNMSTQTGLTFLLRDGGTTNLTIAHNYMKFERIILFGMVWAPQGNNFEFGDYCGVIAANNTALNLSGITGFVLSGEFWAVANGADGLGFTGISNYIGRCPGTIHSYSNGTRGGFAQNGPWYFANLICKNNGSANGGFQVNGYWSRIDSYTGTHNAGDGLSTTTSVSVGSCTSTNNTGHGVSVSGGGRMEVRNLTTSSNSTAGARATTGALLFLDNTSIAEGTKFVTGTSDGSRIEISRYEGSDADFRIWEENALIWSVNTGTVHGSAPISVQCGPAAFHTSAYPTVKRLYINVKDTGTFTFNIWARRSSTNVECKVVIKGGQCSGITSDQADTITAAIDTWEQLTVSGAPGQNCVLCIELHGYQTAGSGTLLFSDTSHTQA